MQIVIVCTLPYRITHRLPPSSLHCCIMDPCHQIFEHATIVNEASYTNQYTTPHDHHSNITKQHIYLNTHQW